MLPFPLRESLTFAFRLCLHGAELLGQLELGLGSGSRWLELIAP